MALTSEVVVLDTHHIVSVAQLRDALNALLDGLPAGANPDDIALSMDLWISLLQGRNQHGEARNEIDFRVAENQPAIKAALKKQHPHDPAEEVAPEPNFPFSGSF